MRKSLIAITAATLFLAACGKEELATQSFPSPHAGQVASANPDQVQHAPAAAPAPQAQSDSGSWLMPAALGFLAGRLTSPSASPTPQVAPSYTPPREPRRWFPSASDKPKVVPTPSAAKLLPAPSKPPMFGAVPKPSSTPAPTAAPKPSYSGPSSYKAPSYSFKPSTPSRSFSSPSRSSGRR